MLEGSIATTFLIVFREALEASLIIGIILTVLARLNQRKYFPHVVMSTFVAILVSFLAGKILVTLTETVQGNAEKLIEGGISLIACGVLTYMIFWMDRQARKFKPEIESQLEKAVSQGELITIISLPFLAVIREGVETVLFLSALSAKNSSSVSLLGGILGLILAVLIVLAIFVGGKKIPLKPLFQGSGIFLLLIAAGLLAYGVHEFQELGLISEIYAPIWNINHILNEKVGLGQFLKSIFGYNGNPSLIEVICYATYLYGVIFFLNKRNFFIINFHENVIGNNSKNLG